MSTEPTTNTRLTNDLRQAFVAALPIMAGYLVLGIPCGILGVHAGMSPLQIAFMSLLFYSGAGQYLIPNMMLAGMSVASIALSVSLVNARHILYGASVSRFTEKAGRLYSFLFAATITDESYGVNLERFSGDTNWSLRKATFTNLLSHLSWISANVAGALLGSFLSPLFTYPNFS